MSADIPRLAWPLTLTPDGALTVLEQDSPEEISQCVRSIVLHRVGDRVDVPEMGCPDYTHGEQPLDLDGLAAIVDRHEPRVSTTTTTTPDAIDTALAEIRVDWQRRPETDQEA